MGGVEDIVDFIMINEYWLSLLDKQINDPPLQNQVWLNKRYIISIKEYPNTQHWEINTEERNYYMTEDQFRSNVYPHI